VPSQPTAKWLRVARLRQGRTWLLPGFAAALVVAAVTGCATAPSGGGVTDVTGRGSQVQAYTIPLPPPKPTKQWQATYVVQAFIQASATYDLDRAAARQYLTSAVQGSWNPLSVTVVRNPVPVQFSSTSAKPKLSHTLGQPVDDVTEVTFTGDTLATLSQSGQYQASSGSAQYQFVLERGANTNNVWLIDQLPSDHILLLTQTDFGLVYQPRNLFFFARPQPGSANPVLVPDPVFAPVQVSDTALNTSLATGLVDGLINDQSGWLSVGTSSAFPPGTRLIGGQVTISGSASAPTALVDLGGSAVKQASGPAKLEMYEQLLLTLRDTHYTTQPIATTVQLEINNKPQDITPSQERAAQLAEPGLPQFYPGAAPLVPEVYEPPASPAAAEPWFGLTGGNYPQVIQQSNSTGSGVTELSPGLIKSPITALAVSQGTKQQLAVAVPDGHGCELEVGYPESGTAKSPAYQAYQLTGSTGPCTSLSWATSGTYSTLWAVAGGQIWALGPDDQLSRVTAPDAAGIGLAGRRIVAMRMAPDGVRAVFLVQGPSGSSHLMLAAVNIDDANPAFGPAVAIGTGLPDPLAFSWYDAFSLAVLAGGKVYEVPLTGSVGTVLGKAPARAQTLASDGRELVAGTAGGELWSSPVLPVTWTLSPTSGNNPIFPG
jgi:hypothetical protein